MSLEDWDSLMEELGVACSEVEAEVRAFHPKALVLQRLLEQHIPTVPCHALSLSLSPCRCLTLPQLVVVHDVHCAEALQEWLMARGIAASVVKTETEMCVKVYLFFRSRKSAD